MFNDVVMIAFIFGAGMSFAIVIYAAWRLWSYVKDLEAIAARKEHTHRTKHGLEDAAGQIIAAEMDVKAALAKLDTIAAITREMRAGPHEYDDNKSLAEREQEVGK